MAHGFCSIFSLNIQWNNNDFAHTASLDKIQHGNHNLDNHHQSFGSWSIARVNVFWLTWAQLSISMHDAIQLPNVWNSNLVFVQPIAKINIVYYCDSILGLLPDICRLLNNNFSFQRDAAPTPAHCSRHTVACCYLRSHVSEFIELDNWPPNSLDIIPVNYSVWDVATDDVVTKFQTLTGCELQLIDCWAQLSQVTTH